MAAITTEPLYHMELINGREIQKPLPKKLQAIIQSYLIFVLMRDLFRSPYKVLTELNVWYFGDRLVPDVIVASQDGKYENGDLVDPAILAIEILSPGQTLTDLLGKADRIVRAGTPVCWVIWPERRKAWMLSTEDLVEARDVLDARLPNGSAIQVQTAEMWAELNEPNAG